jgi:hypothetical protein
MLQETDNPVIHMLLTSLQYHFQKEADICLMKPPVGILTLYKSPAPHIWQQSVQR